jgi:hypothetical protein
LKENRTVSLKETQELFNKRKTFEKLVIVWKAIHTVFGINLSNQ